MFFTPDSLPRVKRTSPGGVVSFIRYTSTQTITVPKGATKAFVRLCGGGGGSFAATTLCYGGAGGAGYLEKLLTGLIAGTTLALTIGAGGTAGNAGGNSTLASGSSTITTLTANGGGGAFGNSANAFGAGGTASNGDLNITGSSGFGFVDTTDSNSMAFGGACLLSPQTFAAVNTHTPGVSFGGGSASATNSATQSDVGAGGVCLIEWFA